MHKPRPKQETEPYGFRIPQHDSLFPLDGRENDDQPRADTNSVSISR
jgi:hypothetical protein